MPSKTNRNFLTTLVAGLVLFGFVLLPSSKASVMDKKTILTFPQRFQIPGMVMEPGTYVIKRATWSTPDILRVLNADETHIYATLMTIPTYRDHDAVSDSPVVTFWEGSGGSPDAIREWFYPGEIAGQEFVYPEGSALFLASTAQTETFTSRQETEVIQEEPVFSEPEVAEVPEPLREEPEPEMMAQAQPPAQQPYQAPQQQAEPMTQQQEFEELPATASGLPLLALLGGAAFAAGAGLKSLSKRKR